MASLPYGVVGVGQLSEERIYGAVPLAKLTICSCLVISEVDDWVLLKYQS